MIERAMSDVYDDADAHRRLQRELFDISRPFVEMKCAVLRRAYPQIIIRSGEAEYVYPPAVVEAIGQIEEMLRSVIVSVLRRYGIVTKEQREAALALVGKLVRFGHRDDVPENYNLVLRAINGMVEIDGFSGEFAPHLFVEQKTTTKS